MFLVFSLNTTTHRIFFTFFIPFQRYLLIEMTQKNKKKCVFLCHWCRILLFLAGTFPIVKFSFFLNVYNDCVKINLLFFLLFLRLLRMLGNWVFFFYYYYCFGCICLFIFLFLLCMLAWIVLPFTFYLFGKNNFSLFSFCINLNNKKYFLKS